MTAEITPYGDATGDGTVQLSFTLPVEAGERAHRAALVLLDKMGLRRAQVVHMKAIDPDHTFFVAYGSTIHGVDAEAIELGAESHPDLSYEDVNRLIRERLRRRMVVVGACTGSDAHTVGLDAILSIKGFAGDKGLENFPEIRVVNLGAQVTPHEIVDAVEREGADAVLVSQVVTQRDVHILHLEQVRDALIEAGRREGLILVGGGPRFTPEQATELGYDRIFGRGTTPAEVASYLAWAIAEKTPA